MKDYKDIKKQNLLNNLHAKKSLATNQFKRISTVLSNLKLHMHAQHEELKKAEKKILEYKQCYQNLKRLKEEEVKLLTKKELIEKQLSIIDQDLQKNKNYLDTIQNALDLSIKNKLDSIKLTLESIYGLANKLTEDIVVLNSAPVLVLSDIAKDIKEGIDISRSVIREEKARKKLENLVGYSGQKEKLKEAEKLFNIS